MQDTSAEAEAEIAAPARKRRWLAAYPAGTPETPEIRPQSVPAMLDGAIAAFGPRVALNYREAEITYAELGAHVARTAHGLARKGVGRGETVALYLPNGPFHPIMFFGTLTAGARVAHLSPLDAFRELEHKCRDSGARTLATLNLPPMVAMAERLLEAGAVERVILCDDAAFGPSPLPLAPLPERAGFSTYAALVEGVPTAPFPHDAAPDDIALLQYTGGTTGLPKGAMLTHGNLTSAVAIYDAWYQGFDRTGAPEQEVALVVLPLFHIYAIVVLLLRQIKEGSQLVLQMRFDPREALAAIKARGITIFPGVPTMWTAILGLDGVERSDLGTLRIVGSGGAPLPVEVKRRFDRLTGLSLGGGWGMTETCSAGTAHPQNSPVEKTGSIGLPLPGIDLKIVDVADPSVELPAGEAGEIAILGPNITRGYWNRHDADRESFRDGWLLTGDVGRIDEDGYVWLVDRKKDMIISSGYNVYPQAVEQAIYEHPAVAECIVIGVPDDYRGEAAKAFVTLRSGAKPFTLEELRGFLSDRVGRHELPAALEFRETLPRTSVGKLSRKELRDEMKPPQA